MTMRLLVTASLLNPFLKPGDNAARGPLKYPRVEFDSSQINQAGTSLKLYTSSLFNDESGFMLCSLANTWVKATTMNMSETQQLHCFFTFPFRLGINGPISEELEKHKEFR